MLWVWHNPRNLIGFLQLIVYVFLQFSVFRYYNAQLYDVMVVP